MTHKIYFYETARGSRDVRIFLRSLPTKHRIKCISYLKWIREMGTGLPSNIVKHLESGLWEARPEYGEIEYRFLFFLHGGHRIGIVAAFVKKRDKIDRRLIDGALRRVEEMRALWQEEKHEQT